MAKWNKFAETAPPTERLVIVYHQLYGLHLMHFRANTSGGMLDERLDGYDENGMLDESGIEWSHWIRTPEPPQ